jgi:hypothetical protein
MLTVGLGGSITMLVTVGLTKNPVQLTARAKVASTAKAPASRSLYFVDDIVIKDSLGRDGRIEDPVLESFSSTYSTCPDHRGHAKHAAAASLEYGFPASAVVKNCSREDSGRRAELYLRAPRNQRG